MVGGVRMWSEVFACGQKCSHVVRSVRMWSEVFAGGQKCSQVVGYSPPLVTEAERSCEVEFQVRNQTTTSFPLHIFLQ